MTNTFARAHTSRRGRLFRSGTRRLSGSAIGLVLLLVVPGGSAVARADAVPGAAASLAEIEACVTRNLPDAAGVLDFRVEAVDRTGEVSASRAEMRWRKDATGEGGDPSGGGGLSQIILRVSEPAQTAGTALLIVDREADQPEFYLRLPEIEKVRRVRSKRLRGPVLGTDFSYEDLKRLRDPLDRANLEVVGLAAIDERPAWLLEAVPKPEDRSEYSRVLTYVDQATCLPLRIDLFGEDEQLRKQLHAPVAEIRDVDGAKLPYVFVMEDHRRETHTVIRVVDYQGAADLPAAQFTRRGLAEAPRPAPAAGTPATEPPTAPAAAIAH